MPKSSDCGTRNPENLKRCPNSGSTLIEFTLVEQIKYPHCGEIKANYSSECWNCGHKLNRGELCLEVSICQMQ